MQVDSVLAAGHGSGVPPLPLVVDLDGTLIRSDLLVETFFAAVGHDWRNILKLVRPFFQGKQHFKAAIADQATVEPSLLPFEPAVLDYIEQARADGRRVYLASASDTRHVRAIAEHLGIFDGWYASDSSVNLSGNAKARCLVHAFGERGFDYLGNDTADLAVWAVANRCVAINTSAALKRRIARTHTDAQIIPHRRTTWHDWLRLLRVHQYTKNALVLVPLLTSQSFTGSAAIAAGLALIAFSLSASSIYIVKDLVDVASDRGHPSKSSRPLASGRVSPVSALMVSAALLISGLACAAAVSLIFVGTLLVYVALTTAYTFSLKRKMLVDAVVLAMLYTLRVLGGAAAINVTISEWLLGFSLFIFTSLALVKRYTELSVRLDRDLPDPTNRNYKVADLPIVASIAAASGFNAVTVFALYISSDLVKAQYSRPLLLWLIAPILMYWISRLLMLAHRRMMNDDPVVFAIRDWRSRVCGVFVGLILMLAW